MISNHSIAQKIVWLNDSQSLIEQDIKKGFDLGGNYLSLNKQKIELSILEYNELASKYANQQGDIDWVVVGPESTQLSKIEDLNRIRKKNGFSKLNTFFIWQSTATNYSRSEGIYADNLLNVIDAALNEEGSRSFESLFRIWQSHKNLAKHRENMSEMNFAEFVIDYCESKLCTEVWVYPQAFVNLQNAIDQSATEDFDRLNELSINWVLINATSEHSMLFSNLKNLYVIGFYHYQEKQSALNDWLIEQFLTQFKQAPNQYVAIGFESMLRMNRSNNVQNQSIIDINNNQLIWRKHQVNFQKGWPVLRSVQMQ